MMFKTAPLAAFAFLAASSWVAPALASPEFPVVIRDTLELDCRPSCTLCHESDPGASGTTDKAFAGAILSSGVDVFTDPDDLADALEVLRDDGVDSDGDGVIDYLELSNGTDPNVAGESSGMGGANSAGPDLVCAAEIKYGCAHVPQSPSKPSTHWYVPLLTSALGMLVMFCRRRQIR